MLLCDPVFYVIVQVMRSVDTMNWFGTFYGVLLQIFFLSVPEDPTELTIVKNALTSLFKMEPKGTVLQKWPEKINAQIISKFSRYRMCINDK